jgi:hypothetical protein
LGAADSTANVNVVGNTVAGAEGSGIDVTAADFAAVSARNNVLRNNGVGPDAPRDGIFFGAATKGTRSVAARHPETPTSIARMTRRAQARRAPPIHRSETTA